MASDNDHAVLGPENDLSTEELLVAARAEILARQEFCPHLAALHDRPTRLVFESAIAATRRRDVVDRQFGVRLLRELGPVPRKDLDEPRTFYKEAARRLVSMLDEESDPRLLACVISAMGYQYNPELLPNILRFKDHEDRTVRFHVASAVGGLLNPDSPDPRAIEGLVALASDEDADVRYDALSTLLEYLSKNPEILRPVVQARSDDTDEQVRGLARAYIATTDSDA